MSTPYGCSCRWVADKGQVEECATHKALREENARLTRALDDAAAMHATCHKERDEAREALAELNAAGLKQYREVNRLKAEVARLENLILDWDRMDMDGAGEEAVALEVEARRIRAAKGE